MRGCSGPRDGGFRPASCLAEQAKILPPPEAPRGPHWTTKGKKWVFGTRCGLCEQRYYPRAPSSAMVGVLDPILPLE